MTRLLQHHKIIYKSRFFCYNTFINENYLLKLGIKYLTLYAFSTENWNRPKQEVDDLMELLVHTIHSETATLNKNDIRLATIGNINSLPVACQKQLQEAIANTANNKRMTLVLALSYSARWEIVEATKKISKASQRLLRALPKPIGTKVNDEAQRNSVDAITTKS